MGRGEHEPGRSVGGLGCSAIAAEAREGLSTRRPDPAGDVRDRLRVPGEGRPDAGAGEGGFRRGTGGEARSWVVAS